MRATPTLTPKRRVVLERLHARGPLDLDRALEGISDFNLIPGLCRIGWTRRINDSEGPRYAVTEAGMRAIGIDPVSVEPIIEPRRTAEPLRAGDMPND